MIVSLASISVNNMALLLNSSDKFCCLPDVTVLHILSYLLVHDQFISRLVCQRWRRMVELGLSEHFRKELTLKLKLRTGLFRAEKHHDFHVALCYKYSKICNNLEIYACPCQSKNLISLIEELHSKVQKLVLKNECPNCCNKDCKRVAGMPLSSTEFRVAMKKFLTTSRFLTVLSFGFECSPGVLEEVSRVFQNEILSLKKLNIANVSEKMKSSKDLKWICKLQDVTINGDLLTDSMLTSWLTGNVKVALQRIRIVFSDNSFSLGERNGVHATKRVSGSAQSNNSNFYSPDDEQNGSVMDHFPTCATWKCFSQKFTNCKVQLIFVSTSMHLSGLLKADPSGVPVNDINIIYKLSALPQCFNFASWFQNVGELKSFAVHGIEPQHLRLFHSEEGEDWLRFCSSSSRNLTKMSLSGLYINVEELLNFVTAVPVLEDLKLSKHDLLMNSQVDDQLQVSLTTQQLKQLEKNLSKHLNREWKVCRDVPLQRLHKQSASVLNRALGLLHSLENDLLVNKK